MADDAKIRVVISGATGKMGREAVKTVLNDPALELVGAVARHDAGEDAGLMAGAAQPCGVLLTGHLAETLAASQADVCVDLTHPEAVFSNTISIIEAGCRPVIGTTGLTPEQLSQVRALLEAKGLGGMVVPNFAIGAVLLMKFAAEAAKYLEYAEIIELHHNRKADAPSGTALKTAELMADARSSGFGLDNAAEKETLPGARGGDGPAGIRIHSVRLPGLVAHQEVLFGGPGQLLTLRHDSLDRSSFMPGIVLCVKRVMTLSGLVYGMEHIL
jgi:4-hydroxy-tetrahydrodipicolinate reductase